MTDEEIYIFLVFASSYQQLLVVNRKQPRLAHRKQKYLQSKGLFFPLRIIFILNNYLENNKCVALKTFLYPPSSFTHPPLLSTFWKKFDQIFGES